MEEKNYSDVVVNDMNQKTTERVTLIAKYVFTTTILNKVLQSVDVEVLKPIVTSSPSGDITEHIRIGNINYQYGMIGIHQFPYDEQLSAYIDEIKEYIDSVKVVI